MPLNSIRQGIRNRPRPIREQTPAEYEEAKRLHVTYQAALDEQSNRIKQVIKEGDGKMKEQLWYEEESIRKFGKTFSSSYTITEDDVNIVCSYCGKIFGEHFGIQCPKDVLL